MKGEGTAGERRVIFTLGTSTRGMHEFLDILQARGITLVCDVRSFPASSRHPHFSRQPFSQALRKGGIEYKWLGDGLGGYRKAGYEAHMKTADFERGLEALEGLALRSRTAVVCAEALPWRCHRRHIAQALEERGWNVVHIIDISRDWTPAQRPTIPLFKGDPAVS
ncbi:MAG: DUF488 domain-containing protein [Actinobacteria bacterium]|jgi:uncharacterized protein (DUF488 family)|nr:MAG: DUF488 domain-containing protein [Actinomycetota bacterium]